MANTPSPGRIVLVRLGPQDFPAIVQDVNSDGTLRVTVFFGAVCLFKRALPEQPALEPLLNEHWRWPVH